MFQPSAYSLGAVTEGQISAAADLTTALTSSAATAATLARSRRRRGGRRRRQRRSAAPALTPAPAPVAEPPKRLWVYPAAAAGILAIGAAAYFATQKKSR